jgi:hypothetical protein
MKLQGVLGFAALAAAAPFDLEKRQGNVCFVFARGSTEPAPLVSPPRLNQWQILMYLQGMLIGPQLQSALKGHFPGMRTIPVMYQARIDTNISPQRTDASSIAAGNSAFKQASSCGTIIAGGYSQGAAGGCNSPSKDNS